MNYIQTEIDGVWLIEPKVFHDARGYFMEAFRKKSSVHMSETFTSSRTMSPNPLSVYYVVFITRRVIAARPNWYVSLREKCWTWLST